MDKSGALYLHSAVRPEEVVAQLAMNISNKYPGVLCTKHKSGRAGLFQLHIRKQSVRPFLAIVRPYLDAGILG